jgi:CheY-like chemotaxis protein
MMAGDGKAVLVVEDDSMLRESLAEILECEGFAPAVAKDGREALHLLRNDHVVPVVILLDLMMPVMNGWQFREEQLADVALASFPVIVMTAMDPEGIRADAFVRKPFDIDELLGKILRVAARRKQRVRH